MWLRMCLVGLIYCAGLIGCTKRMPVLDMSQLDAAFVEKCKAHGAIVIEDERYEDYWARNYDNYRARLVGQMGTTGSMTLPDALRRRVLHIFSKAGIETASHFEVVHYQSMTPPVDVHAWTADGTPKAMNVDAMGTVSAVNWPCRSGHPRTTRFRIGPLNPGDTVEILHPLSGPEQEVWNFGDENFCSLKSKVAFGHKHDSTTTRLDMDAVRFDGSGVVARTSLAGQNPVVYASTRALEAMAPDQIPFVIRSARCRGFEYLNGRVFHTPIWMARDGSLPSGEMGVPADLLNKVEGEGMVARIGRVAEWVAGITIYEQPVGFWARALPREPAVNVARGRRGSKGGIAALVFRLLEEAGLEPRFALVHTDRTVPFVAEFASPILFDTLAVVVADHEGRDHWLAAGAPYQVGVRVPTMLRNRKALLMKRWVAERISGGGSCWPEFDMLHSCFNASKGLDSMELVTIGL